MLTKQHAWYAYYGLTRAEFQDAGFVLWHKSVKTVTEAICTNQLIENRGNLVILFQLDAAVTDRERTVILATSPSVIILHRPRE